jgi:uncharacterized protein
VKNIAVALVSEAACISIKCAKHAWRQMRHVIYYSSRGNSMTEHRGGSGNFAEDKEKASEAGKKGGQNSGGNFKNDREKASEAGKKGGQNSHRDS